MYPLETIILLTIIVSNEAVLKNGSTTSINIILQIFIFASCPIASSLFSYT